jgi:hypothetical protein
MSKTIAEGGQNSLDHKNSALQKRTIELWMEGWNMVTGEW